MRPVLETPRLILRPFAEEDADAVFAVYSDRETNTFFRGFSCANPCNFGDYML